MAEITSYLKNRVVKADEQLESARFALVETQNHILELQNEIEKLQESIHKIGYTVNKLGDGVYELVKSERDAESGTYLNPIRFVHGIFVAQGLWYKFDDGNIWECIKSGVGEYTKEWFDIVG